MLNEQLKEISSAYKFKDMSGIPYFIDVIGVQKTDGDNEMNMPLLTVSQARRKATGAETFERIIDFVEKNKKYVAVIVNEYNSIDDDAMPIETKRIDLLGGNTTKTSNKMAKQRTKKELEEENEALRQQMERYNPMQTNGMLGAINQAMEMFGVQGGLGAVAQNTAMLMTTQDKLDDAKLTITELKGTINNLNSKIDEKDSKIEDLKNKNRNLEDDLREAKRNHAQTVERYEQKLSIGSLASQGLFGFLGKQFKLDEKLAGVLGDADTDAPASVQQPQVMDIFSDIPEDNAKLIKPCVTYLKSLDYTNLQMMVSIIQYCSKDNANIIQMAKVVKTLLNPKPHDNTGDSNNNS